MTGLSDRDVAMLADLADRLRATRKVPRVRDCQSTLLQAEGRGVDFRLIFAEIPDDVLVIGERIGRM